MNDIQKELDTAFSMLSQVSIRAEYAETMVEIRDHLRRAYKLAAKMAEPKAEEVE